MNSVSSQWIHGECEAARQDGRLVPVVMEQGADIPRPLMPFCISCSTRGTAMKRLHSQVSGQPLDNSLTVVVAPCPPITH
jgi:hypothetical protein